MIPGRVARLALVVSCAACVGTIDGSHGVVDSEQGVGGQGGGMLPGTPPPAGTSLVAGRAALRRLTENELRNTLKDLLGTDPGVDLDVWPEDARTPFDNDYTTQFGSRAVVEAAKSIAEKAAIRLLTDPAGRQRVVGCAPASPSDSACFKQFISRFGRRALRRPLATDEIDRYAAFIAHNTASGDFYTAVGMVVRAMLQDVELLYRIELGTPVPKETNLFRLNNFEVATRLSYLLWGSAPDDELLDVAARSGLASPAGVRSAAARLLGAKRARERVGRFHSLWLGYERSTLPGNLDAKMQVESAALIDRVVFDDKASWLEIFQRKESYVDDTLAAHYGMTRPNSTTPKWVPYGTTGRQGLLSHGTFLSVAAKFNDTSPTQRGKMIRERLLCQEIPLPDPSMMVNVDEPPKGDAMCKYDRYVAHRQGGCAACHSLMDPVGFGLENYDTAGKYRTTEPNLPACRIAGQGELVGVGTFRGPAELGNLLIKGGDLDRCAVMQMYRFASGRKELTEEDRSFVDLLTMGFRQKTNHFDELLLEYASQPAFGYRVIE